MSWFEILVIGYLLNISSSIQATYILLKSSSVKPTYVVSKVGVFLLPIPYLGFVLFVISFLFLNEERFDRLVDQ